MATTRRPLVAGNWKMNGLRADGSALASAVRARADDGCDVALCPPATLLTTVAAAIQGSPLLLGGQDCATATHGAHTGDIAAPMLADAGCKLVILGHSERRHDHGESSALVRAKAEAAVAAGLAPIICVGETEAERDAGRALAVVGLGLLLLSGLCFRAAVRAFRDARDTVLGKPTRAEAAVVAAVEQENAMQETAA